MKVDLVEAKAWHVGQMARQLRHEHAVAMGGVKTHRELRDAFEMSVLRRAWLFDGKLASIGGVIGSVVADEGTIWMAVTEAAIAHPLHVARGAQRYVDEVMEVKRCLSITVLEADRSAIGLAYFLGFRAEVWGIRIMGIPAMQMIVGVRRAA